MRKSIKHKNRLYKAFIKSPSTLRESHYKNFRNKLTHLIRRAKRTYYDGQFERTKNDLKSTWKLINEIINKRNSKPAMTSTFKADDKSITDPVIIAEKCCQYFSSIDPTLAKKIPSVSSSFTSFLPENINLPIIMLPTNQFELQKICRASKSGKFPGYDNIPMHIIKKSFDVIFEPLGNVINLSLATGIFPDKLKIAKVIPINKTEDHDCFTNYIDQFRYYLTFLNYSRKSCIIV